jgi:large subunit ribosomal protein L13
VKTYAPKAAEIKRERHVIDASGKVLGRLASKVASLLIGKHKPIFSPNADVGDFVIVFNADKVQFTGEKTRLKLYYRHSGYPGGFRVTTLEKLMETHPERALEHAIKGMLPHTRLGARMRKRLQVYAGDAPPNVAKVKTETKQASEV